MSNLRPLGKVVTRIEVDYGDVDDLVHEVYGPTIPELANYEFAAVAEAHSGMSYSFSPNGEPLRPYDQSKWDKRDFNCNCLIMDKLCADGYIVPGDYSVEVYW